MNEMIKENVKKFLVEEIIASGFKYDGLKLLSGSLCQIDEIIEYNQVGELFADSAEYQEFVSSLKNAIIAKAKEIFYESGPFGKVTKISHDLATCDDCHLASEGFVYWVRDNPELHQPFLDFMDGKPADFINMIDFDEIPGNLKAWISENDTFCFSEDFEREIPADFDDYENYAENHPAYEEEHPSCKE